MGNLVATEAPTQCTTRSPQNFPLTSVLTPGITGRGPAGSRQTTPLLHIQQGQLCQLKTSGGNSHRHPDTGALCQAQLSWPPCTALATPGAPAHFPQPMARPPLPDKCPLCPLTYSTQTSKHALARPLALLPLRGFYFSNGVLRPNRETTGVRVAFESRIRLELTGISIKQGVSHGYAPNTNRLGKLVCI